MKQTKKYKNDKLNAFTIAHYILMFFIVVFCIGIIAWVSVRPSHTAHKETHAIPTVHANIHISPCAQRFVNHISQVWAYTPDSVPQKYLNMAHEYANERITTNTRGTCNNIKFRCRVGDIRRNCDPCATSYGMQIAKDHQIADTIQQLCDE